MDDLDPGTATLSEADLAWASVYPEPPRINMNGKNPREIFTRNGTLIFKQLERALHDHMRGTDIASLDILEFGCGVGRVAMPFFHAYGRPNACVEMQPQALAFMREALPGANPVASTYAPPLAYADGAFDVIYAISVWTHMEPDMGLHWLEEMNRLLRPGGLALISTSSFGPLARHREDPVRSKLWADVSDDDLRQQGCIFRGREMSLMGGVYGCTVHAPEWVAANWARLFEVCETRVDAIGGEVGKTQDLNILRKR